MLNRNFMIESMTVWTTKRYCKNCDEILDAQNIPNIENGSFDFVYCWRCDFFMRIN